MISRSGYIPHVRETLRSPILKSTRDVTIVVPVKDNQVGIDRFLQTFFKVHHTSALPAEIIIVDNCSAVPVKIPEIAYPIPVRITVCEILGPGSARNHGVSLASTEWVLFTDSDCVPTATMTTGYLSAQNGSIGYAGNIVALGKDLVSKYYQDQEILIPPEVKGMGTVPVPDYLVTANCLVWLPAFHHACGFNSSIRIAGGEDIDLGFKLRTIGALSYAPGSVAKHDFSDGLSGFRKRFRRYGEGNKIVEGLYSLDLKPGRFMPNRRSVVNFVLAYIQYRSLKKGYYKRPAYKSMSD